MIYAIAFSPQGGNLENKLTASILEVLNEIASSYENARFPRLLNFCALKENATLDESLHFVMSLFESLSGAYIRN